MGVYNPKKKMPTSCYMCWDSLYCEYKIKNPVKMAQGRADNCPLIEIDDTEGYKDGTEEALEKIKEQIMSEVFGNDKLKG